MDVGIIPSGDRAETIRAITERGVAHVAEKDIEHTKSRAGEVDAHENVDVDAQPIADSTLRTLPERHPGQNTPVATLDVLRAPDEVDDRPTVDHRPQPESSDYAEDVADTFPSQSQVLAAPMDDTMIEGKTREEVTGESVSPDDAADAFGAAEGDDMAGESTMGTRKAGDEQISNQPSAQPQTKANEQPNEGSTEDAASSEDITKTALYERAQELDIAGRSTMSKEELQEAVEAAEADQGNGAS